MLGISINVILLGLTSFLTDISSEMINPILPMFITALGGTGLIVGLIAGLANSITSILQVFSGYWSDKFGKRKPFVFFGYSISALSKLFFPLATLWHHILILKPIERFGKGLRTAPRDAIIADSVNKNRRGAWFGVHRAMDTGGAILGSVLVFILFWIFGLKFRKIFLVAAIIAFTSLLPLLFVRDRKIKPKKVSLKISLKGLPKPLKLFVLVASVFALGNFSYMFFILRAQKFFVQEMSVAIPIFLYIIFNIFYALFSIPSGILSDKIGRKNVIFLGYFLFVLTCLGFVFSTSLIVFIVLFALYGLVYALVDGNQRAFVSDLAKKELKGIALGTFHTSISLATLPSSLIAGFIWQFNPSMTFVYGAFVASVACILFLLMK
jgi:MFS family permease